MSCPNCEPSRNRVPGGADAASRSKASHTPTIALVGNPNVGKSTLFNRLTGSHQRTVNSPGTTVDVTTGTWRELGATLIDLPGTYSLVPSSPDEAVVTRTLETGADTFIPASARAAASLVSASAPAGARPAADAHATADASRDSRAGVLTHLITRPRRRQPASCCTPEGGDTTGAIDLIIAVLDGTSLTRSLYLLAQIGQAGYPVVAVVTMTDVVSADELPSAHALTTVLQIPVVFADPRRSDAVPAVAHAVRAGLRRQPHLSGLLADPAAPGTPTPHTGSGDGAGGRANATSDARSVAGTDEAAALERATILFTWVEEAERRARRADAQARDAAPLDGSSATSLDGADYGVVQTDAIPGAHPEAHAHPDLGPATAPSAARPATTQGTAGSTTAPAPTHPRYRPSASDRVDRILLHPLSGTAVFLGIMWLLFQLAGTWVGPIQDWADGLFSATDEGAWSLANGVTWVLAEVGWTGTWVESLLVGGICAGLGVVASFVPLMLVIYAALSLLEDSGYMARAAFLGDRLMRKIGLDGRVILPLIMGFGCNVPALAATKNLPDRRQRLITVLVTPYTSCAARLTIYLMIAKIFFTQHAGTVVFGMYLLSILMVVLGAAIAQRIIPGRATPGPLLLVLPPYQVPRLLITLRTACQRSWVFVRGAGKLILLMTVLVWLMSAIPMRGGHSFADADLPMEDSLYGATAQVLEPVFAPTGFGEWHMTGALMTGFVAKETVVSSIVTSYNMDPAAAGNAEDNGDDLGELPALLTNSLTESAGVGRQGLAAFAFLVFVLTYTPCLATVAEQARQIGGRRTTIAVVAQLVAAWLLATAIFQIGGLLL